MTDTPYNPDDYTLIIGDHDTSIWCRHCTWAIEDEHGHTRTFGDDTNPLSISALDKAASEHHQQRHTPARCPATIEDYADTRQCDDIPDHFGVHTHLNTWWPNERAGTLQCPTERCRQYTGHDGPCQLYPKPAHTNEEPPW